MAAEKLFKMILGLLFVIAGIYLIVFWWNDFLTLLKGGIPLVLGLIGLIFILLGFEN